MGEEISHASPSEYVKGRLITRCMRTFPLCSFESSCVIFTTCMHTFLLLILRFTDALCNYYTTCPLPFVHDHHFVSAVELLKLCEGGFKGGILCWIKVVHEGYAVAVT
jgi:hypothetical protein